MSALKMPQHQALAVQSRGAMIESVHFGSLIAVKYQSGRAVGLGEVTSAIYPRSALKPLMAVAMLRAGVDLSEQQLAVAAASHSGASEHQDIAASTLRDAGLVPVDLRNSTDLPYGVEEKAQWLRNGHGPTQLAQDCSGKHAALLATCVKNGWPSGTYLDQDHPLPSLIRAVVEELTQERIEVVSTDGCGTEVFGLSLGDMARAIGPELLSEFTNIAVLGGGQPVGTLYGFPLANSLSFFTVKSFDP